MRRAAALVEVVAAFVLVHLAFRSFKHFTPPGRAEVAAGLNFSAGTAMALFTVAVLLPCRRSFARYGLTGKDWRYNVNAGLLWGLLNAAMAAAVLTLAPIPFDPRSPPDVTRTAAACAGELVNLLLLVWFLRRDRLTIRRIPVAVSLAALAGLLALPPALAWYSSRPVVHALLSVLWLFFGAGFGEEVFFRGYVQSRVNEAFGRPFRLLGVEFGPGLLVSALLFGFTHALNTVDYFNGRWDFAWWWCGANVATGLFYGCWREKTGSVLPGAVHHGLLDVLARVPALLP